MLATKLFLQFSNKPCLDLLVCSELWNWNKNHNRFLVLNVNFLQQAFSRINQQYTQATSKLNRIVPMHN